MNARHVLSALLLAMAPMAAMATTPPVTAAPGEAAWAGKATPALAWRGPQATSAASQLSFGDLDPARIASLQDRNATRGTKAMQIGIARNADEEGSSPLPSLRWQAITGGSVARIEIRSPDAVALRVGLRLVLPDDRIELRFAGSDEPNRVVTMSPAFDARRLVDDSGLHWSSLTEGDTQFIEVFAPTGADLDAIRVEVPEISHLVTSPSRGFSIAPKIGESESCNVDTACRVGALGQDFVNAKNSVAWLVFGAGGTSICTGTLLNDTVAATQVPYFFTAEHCIGTQSTANTVTTVWRYEATSCGSGVSTATTTVGGGATLLVADDAGPINSPPYEGTDATLLRLNSAPPGSAYFAGWNAAALAIGDDVLAIHHPSGDAKKSSLGRKTGNESEQHVVGWLSGTTEGGSSGSAIFTNSGGYQVRGGLFGGSASCANDGDLATPGNRDIYSRFDLAYPQLQPFLAPAAQTFGPGVGRNYTGAWYVPSEAGWGLTAFQFDPPAQTLFVMFFIYDQTGKAQWFEMGGGWTATDVRAGDVLQSNGPPWGPTFNPAARTFTVAGTASLTFTSATTANLVLTVNGATRTVAIVKL